MTFKTRSMVLMEFVKKFFLTFLIFLPFKRSAQTAKIKIDIDRTISEIIPRYMVFYGAKFSSADEEWEYQIA
jgi:hypothetical protein